MALTNKGNFDLIWLNYDFNRSKNSKSNESKQFQHTNVPDNRCRRGNMQIHDPVNSCQEITMFWFSPLSLMETFNTFMGPLMNLTYPRSILTTCHRDLVLSLEADYWPNHVTLESTTDSSYMLKCLVFLLVLVYRPDCILTDHKYLTMTRS